MNGIKLISSAVIMLIAGSLFFFLLKNNPANGLIDSVNNFSSKFFINLSGFKSYIAGLDNINKINRENIKLNKENSRLLSQLASLKEIEDENIFLRQSLGISAIKSSEILEGGIFNINFMPGEHSLYINRGEEDNVLENNVVISSEGVLIGIVKRIFKNYSKVSIITSPDFKSTVKVLDSRVAAIARGTLDGGIVLDFVSQEDEVREDDYVVTSGNDLIPSGLIIGKINYVGIDESSLFKEVRVHPLLRDLDLGKVIIIKQ